MLTSMAQWHSAAKLIKFRPVIAQTERLGHLDSGTTLRAPQEISMWPNPMAQPQQHQQHKHEDIRAPAQVKQTPSKATHTWHGRTLLLSEGSEGIVGHHGSSCLGDVGLEGFSGWLWKDQGNSREEFISPRKPKLATQKGACLKKIPPNHKEEKRKNNINNIIINNRNI